ncbi:hypothetical protein [Absidia glauca]|uniref:Uncharacterized protein n=1 Tax=Absidia glauca TaxID=4829 RepID=A0A168MZ39_ABSGL|nr:hypothetical protein [Absidia glauca]
MVSQSSILFLLAFSLVAVSARHFDRRAPGAPGETTDQTQTSHETLNKVLACTDDNMKTPNTPPGTTAEPRQSPLPWVDTFVKCMEIYYPKSSQAQDPATGQAAFEIEGFANGQTASGEQTSPIGQTIPNDDQDTADPE